MPLHNPQRRNNELTRANVNARFFPLSPIKRPLLSANGTPCFSGGAASCGPIVGLFDDGGIGVIVVGELGFFSHAEANEDHSIGTVGLDVERMRELLDSIVV